MIIRFLLILLLAPFFVIAQNKSFEPVLSEYRYRLTYQIDSTDVSNTRIEMFKLQRGKQYSMFMSENSFIRDSIVSVTKELDAGGTMAFLSKMPKTNFSYRILKNIGDNEIKFYDNIVTKPFNYEEKLALNWVLTGKKEEVNGILCDVAEVSYGGRNYVAYYSSEIPVPDGPYKFYGLPGLIVKIQDKKNHYIFELVNYRDVSKDGSFIKLKEKLVSGKKMSKENFFKTLKNSNENFINELAGVGFAIDPAQQREVMKRRNKRNNPIELKP